MLSYHTPEDLEYLPIHFFIVRSDGPSGWERVRDSDLTRFLQETLKRNLDIQLARVAAVFHA